MSRPLALLFASTFGTMVSFYLLLSVVPLYAASVGAGGIGAGLATGALRFATVAWWPGSGTGWCMPRDWCCSARRRWH
jgi:hypothetical protein